MHAAVIGERLAADVLHNIDLATRGPADGIDVGSQHPKGRPYPLSEGAPEPGFKPGIFLSEFAPGQQASRRVIPRHSVRAGVIFLDGFNDQVAVSVEKCVIGSGRVVLQLVISPAVSSYIVSPFGLVRD